MTEDYLTPIERTLELTGPAPYSMEQGLDETFRWLAARGDSKATPIDSHPPIIRSNRTGSTGFCTLASVEQRHAIYTGIHGH